MVSGVGVVDKSVALLEAVQLGARSLSDLTQATGMSKPTAHRIAVALETQKLLRRDRQGQFHLGWRLVALGRAAEIGQDLISASGPLLAELRDQTGESAQLYVRDGEQRVCVAASESAHGLRTIVTVGAVLPIQLGSAGHVLLGKTPARGWRESVAEREVGVASVSAPVHDPDSSVIAAIGVSGPLERVGKHPGHLFGADVVRAARQLETILSPRLS